MRAPSSYNPLRAVGIGVTFVDNDGVYWTVTERDATDLPGTRGPRCLIFASPEAIHRVWEFPAGWRDLSTQSLIALSWAR